MDTLIGVIYMGVAYELARALSTDSLLHFGLLAVAVQWIGDLLFAAVFLSVPTRFNAVLDFFKGYAEEAQLGALLGDTFLVNVAVLLSSLLETFENPRYVAYVLVLLCYEIPYLVHTYASADVTSPVRAVVAPTAASRAAPVPVAASTAARPPLRVAAALDRHRRGKGRR